MFKIKICGITTPDDALLAAAAGADAIGLNFYEKSQRYITRKTAAQIKQVLRRDRPAAFRPRLLGVYVNMDSDQLVSHILDTGINESQFHGDEPPTMVAGFKGARIDTFTHLHPITTETLDEYSRQTDLSYPSDMDGFPLLVRAFRLHDNSLSFVTDYLRDCQSAGALPSAILLDAHQSGSYGGTGQTIDWNMIRDQRDKLLGLPLILAGGLTPDNVADAIATARPDAVDVASGVESSPGKKDPAKVRDFIAAAKEAFAAIGG